MGGYPWLRADDVGLADLFELGAIEATGQVFCDLLLAKVNVVGMYQPGVAVGLAPELAHCGGQQAKRTPCALEVRDRCHLEIQDANEFGVKRVGGRNFLEIIGPECAVMDWGVLGANFQLIRHVAFHDRLRCIMYDALEQAMHDDCGYLVFRR